MKVKKHYNSFHPTLGFFLHLHDVMSWFDAESSHFETVCLYSDAFAKTKKDMLPVAGAPRSNCNNTDQTRRFTWTDTLASRLVPC